MTESQQYVETLRKEYIDNHIRLQERDELIAENNIEKRDIKGYHGREILELLQNADDAYQKSIDLGNRPDCNLVVKIKFFDNTLTVANTGTFFDKEGIKAIVQGNNSPKVGRYIGNKGTGFRSVLNWATKVRIFSGEFAIEFSKEIASGIFNEIKNEPQISKQIQKKPGLYIPMLAVPKNIEHSRLQNYTTIEIEVNNQEQNDDFSVEKQLSGIDLRILLFLPNISKIEIETEKSNIVYERLKDGEEQNKMMLRKTENGVLKEERFTLFKKNIPQAIKEDDILKDIQLSIAVPDKDMIGTNHVYSYFPLFETDSPFNCVLHATYALGDHRNNINLSEENKRIVREQLSFLVEIAVKLVEKGQYDEAYRILLPSNYSVGNWRFTSSFSKFNLEEYYIQLLKDKPLFQTVNRKRISINESPKYIYGAFPKVFTKGPFEKLLMQSNDENRKNLLNLISGRIGIDLSYREEDLCKCVNQISSKWKISQQVDVFVWWNSRYKNTLPQLIKTQQNKWIKLHDECYFLEGDFDSIKLPKWVSVQAINDEYQKYLLSKSKNEENIITHLQDLENGRKKSVARIISQNNIYHTVNFRYRDRSNIISAINSSVNTYKKAVEFVKWLWKYYHTSETEKGIPDFSMRFPSKNKVVVDSKSLFFGEEYGNDLSESLFGDNFSSIPGFEAFGIQKEDVSDFKAFLIKYGVREFPEIKKTKIVKILPKYDTTVKRQIMDSGELRGTASFYIPECRYDLPYIENVDSLLQTLSTDNVIKWLLNDTELEMNLSSPYASTATVSYYGNTQYKWRKYNGKVPNYLLFLFNEIPWVKINNKRYAPNQVLKGYNLRNNKKFNSFVPVITEQVIEGIASKLKVKCDDVAAVFNKFAFAEKVTDLSSEVFYGLMLDLQSSQNILDQELSRTIYRIIEQPGFEREFEQSKNKETFLKTGQLLVKYQGKIQYYHASKSYLPSTRIINKNNFPIVEKGQRTNNAKFVELFGCKEYKKDASVKKGSERISPSNDQFQRYFADFQKYARAYRERNENVEKNIDKLKVVLVNSIEILENDSTIPILENYSLVKDTTSSWFIVCQGDFNINYLSEKIEDIYANIANTPGFDAGKIGELFRAESKSQKEFLIKKEFGSLDVIEDESYQNAIKRNFCETLLSIDSSVKIEDLDIDFNDFQNQENCPRIIRLFSDLSIDIDDFEKAGFVYSINLREHYASLLESFIRKEQSRFKDVQYCKAINDDKLQQSFISMVDDFGCFHQIAEIDNSVKFDLESVVVQKFGEWRTVKCDKCADEQYKSNYEWMNPNKLFEDEIANNQDLQRMFYFGLKDEFETWVKKHNTVESVSLSSTSEDKYAPYKTLIPDETEVNYTEEKKQYPFKGRTVHRGAFSQSFSSKSNENLKEKGNKGELSIYNLLCEKYGKYNVIPRSEAFVELGILKPGQAVSGDYDVSYKDTEGNEFFVEVKTGSRNMFYMSPGELQFAKSHSDSYRVYYVYDIESNSPKYSILPDKFWEDNNFRITEIVEKIEIVF